MSEINDSNKFGKNIRKLMEAHDESELDLALAIDASGSSTISNYISYKNTRKPKPEFMKRIANHYGLPIYVLQEYDLSNLNYNFKTIPIDILQQIDNVIFPFIKIEEAISEEALNDIDFKIGYEAQKRIYECIKTNNEYSDDDWDTMINSYCSSDAPESSANLISFLLRIGAVLQYPNLTDINDYLNGESVDIVKLRKKTLKDFDDTLDKETMDFYLDIDDIIYSLILHMKNSKHYLELSNYFIALKYFYNVTKDMDNNNKIIGIEMMRAFAATGNKYAKKFLNIIEAL